MIDMNWFPFLFGLIVAVFILYSLYKDATKPLWDVLVSKYEYRDFSTPQGSVFFNTEMVFFWDEETDDLHNAMHVTIEENGLGLRAPIIKPYIKSILIPWGELEVDGVIFRWLCCRVVLRIREMPVKLAVAVKHKNEIESRIKRLNQKSDDGSVAQAF